MADYDPTQLEWNDTHTINEQHRYCYCGEDRSIVEVCLQCHQCLNWFHERCIRVPLGPIVPLVTNYRFQCLRCVVLSRPAGTLANKLEEGNVPLLPTSPPASLSEDRIDGQSDDVARVPSLSPVPPAPSVPASARSSVPPRSPPQAVPADPSELVSTATANAAAVPRSPAPVTSPTAKPAPCTPTPQPLTRASSSGSLSSAVTSDLSSPELDPSLLDDSDDDRPVRDADISPLLKPTIQPDSDKTIPDLGPAPSVSGKELTPPLVPTDLMGIDDPAPTPVRPPSALSETMDKPKAGSPSADVPPPTSSTPVPVADLYAGVEETYERTSAGWKDICATTIANLTLERLRNEWDPADLFSAQAATHPLPACYFNKQDIVPFVDNHWKALCTFRSRTTTWWATLGSCLYTVNNVFITQDGGRRTAASDFRLMDVNLWNFRPGAIPPRPNRSAMSSTHAHTNSSPVATPATTAGTTTPGPILCTTVRPPSSSGDATRLPIAPKSGKKRPNMDGSRASAATPVDGTPSKRPASVKVQEEHPRLASHTVKSEPFTPVMTTLATPGVTSTQARTVNRKLTRTDRAVPGLADALFASFAAGSQGAPVPVADPPVKALNDKEFVYTPLAGPPNSYWPAEPGESPAASCALSHQDRHPSLYLSRDGTEVTTGGRSGFRSVRGVYPITQGQYYVEYLIKRAETGEAAPHVRIGISLPQADLEGPVGSDRYGYGLRDESGEVIHNGKRQRFGESFRTGDVIGLLITIPALPEFGEFGHRRRLADLQGLDNLHGSSPRRSLPAAVTTPHLVTIGDQVYLRTREFSPTAGTTPSYGLPPPPTTSGAWIALQHPTTVGPPIPCCGFTEPPKRTGGGRGRGGRAKSAATAAAAAAASYLGPTIPGSQLHVFKNGRPLGAAFQALHTWLPPAHHLAASPLSPAVGFHGPMASPLGRRTSTGPGRKGLPYTEVMASGEVPQKAKAGRAGAAPATPTRAYGATATGSAVLGLAGSWDLHRPGYYPTVSVYCGGSVIINPGPDFLYPPPAGPKPSSPLPSDHRSGLFHEADQQVWRPYSDLWTERAVADTLGQLVQKVTGEVDALATAVGGGKGC
ncbi:transcription factor, contains a PHD finger motif [Tieghemiomyces parasiticus]|uniref:Transcription factor, contains a PHD finger motif n=1 Tax=Tieghemiomyces parasiticus TaxID=78921 RepID=A0A9W8E0N8_9FUNG|nr:transcription factor, contains a PHD finger motif [Tieghemiomyces parasiticus]